MKGKILLGILLGIMLVGFVSATSISIDSISFKDRNGNSLSTVQYTGDQIWAEITITNPEVFQDLRYPYLSWSQPNNQNAWVSCNSRWDLPITQTIWHWECILTVTPQMTATSDVHIKTDTHIGNNADVLLGTFNFKGNPVATTQSVKFNGNWSAGTTLYSDWYNGTSIIGKSVYPISTQTCTQTVVCASQAYHWEKTCLSYYPNGKCKSSRQIRINDGCSRYTTRTLCKRTAAICFNADGSKTNQLDLSNFAYTYDGVTWNDILYSKQSISGQVQFRVIIPSYCFPAYNINQAIKVG